MTYRLALAGALLLPATAAAGVSAPKKIAQQRNAHCEAPRWAPDGAQIAYEVFHPKKSLRETWIVKVSADGAKSGSPKEVTTGKGSLSGLGGKKQPVVDFAWAPNMKQLNNPYVFSSQGPKKNFDLFADGDWLTSNVGNDGQPAWRPSGLAIAYTSQQKSGGDILMLDLGTGETKKLTDFRNATELSPRWAPNGRSLLFVRAMSGSKGQDVGVIDDVGRPAVRMVTEWIGDEIRPTFSPDGTQIAFYANKGNADDKVFDLWVIGADGTNPKKLASNVVYGLSGGPAWTPDSSTLLFVKQDFKKNNPVRWVRRDGAQAGRLATGTQLNGDLAVYGRPGDTVRLAFKAQGKRGAADKTWYRLYVVTFSMDDLAAEAE